MRIIISIAIFGALGAVARYGLMLGGERFISAKFPAGVLIANVLGSFVAGFLAGAGMKFVMSASLRQGLGVGFLGAFTTFSAFSAKTTEMLNNKTYGLALLNVCANVLLSLLAAGAGFALAHYMFDSTPVDVMGTADTSTPELVPVRIEETPR